MQTNYKKVIFNYFFSSKNHQSNVEALEIAKQSEFETIDQLKQGAATLGSIVSTTLPKAHVGALLDMKGRKHAVEMMEVCV